MASQTTAHAIGCSCLRGRRTTVVTAPSVATYCRKSASVSAPEPASICRVAACGQEAGWAVMRAGPPCPPRHALIMDGMRSTSAAVAANSCCCAHLDDLLLAAVQGGALLSLLLCVAAGRAVAAGGRLRAQLLMLDGAVFLRLARVPAARVLLILPAQTLQSTRRSAREKRAPSEPVEAGLGKAITPTRGPGKGPPTERPLTSLPWWPSSSLPH